MIRKLIFTWLCLANLSYAAEVKKPQIELGDSESYPAKVSKIMKNYDGIIKETFPMPAGVTQVLRDPNNQDLMLILVNNYDNKTYDLLTLNVKTKEQKTVKNIISQQNDVSDPRIIPYMKKLDEDTLLIAFQTKINIWSFSRNSFRKSITLDSNIYGFAVDPNDGNQVVITTPYRNGVLGYYIIIKNIKTDSEEIRHIETNLATGPIEFHPINKKLVGIDYYGRAMMFYDMQTKDKLEKSLNLSSSVTFLSFDPLDNNIIIAGRLQQAVETNLYKINIENGASNIIKICAIGFDWSRTRKELAVITWGNIGSDLYDANSFTQKYEWQDTYAQWGPGQYWGDFLFVCCVPGQIAVLLQLPPTQESGNDLHKAKSINRKYECQDTYAWQFCSDFLCACCGSDKDPFLQ